MGRHHLQARSGRRRRGTRGRQFTVLLFVSLGVPATLGIAGNALPGEAPLPRHRTPAVAMPAPVPAQTIDLAPSLIQPKVVWPGQPIRERKVLEVATVKPLAEEVATAAQESKRPRVATASREKHRPRVATPTKRETAAEHPTPSPRPWPWPRKPQADHDPKPDPGTDPEPSNGGGDEADNGEHTDRSHPVRDAVSATVRAVVKKHKENNSNHGERK